MKFAYKTKHNFEKRRAEGDRVRINHPNRIPVICEKAPSTNYKSLPTEKFLVGEYITVAEFCLMIRKKIDLRPEDALFFFCNDTIPSMMMTMGQLWQDNHEEDLFVYISFSDESVYGGDKKSDN